MSDKGVMTSRAILALLVVCCVCCCVVHANPPSRASALLQSLQRYEIVDVSHHAVSRSSRDYRGITRDEWTDFAMWGPPHEVRVVVVVYWLVD